MKFSIVLLYLLLVPVVSYPQHQSNVDSLLIELDRAANDGTRTLILNELATTYRGNDDQKALNYAQRVIQIADNGGFKQDKATALNTIALIYLSLGKREEVESLLKLALELQKEIGNDEDQATTLNNLGLLYTEFGKLDIAFDYHIKSTAINEAYNNKTGISANLNNMAHIFYLQKKYQKAIDYLEESTAIEREANSMYGVAGGLNNLGVLYSKIGKQELAMTRFREALSIHRNHSIFNEVVNGLNNIGNIFLEYDQLDSAIKYYKKAISVGEEYQLLPSISIAYNNIGKAFLKQDKIALALKSTKKAYQINKEINQKVELTESLLNYSLIYKKTEQYDSAYKYQKLYSIYKDSIHNERNERQMAEMETRYETQRKEKEIEILNKEKELQELESSQKELLLAKKSSARNILLTGMGLILLIAFLLYNRYQLKQKSKFELKAIQMELKALRAQINPHFTFNIMTSIQHYILDNQPDAAQKYLGKFARLVRSVLDNSETPLVTIEEDLKALDLYVELDTLRFENNFDYKKIIDEEIDVGFDRIPAMLLQPHVENAIWHGLQHKEGKGKITVELKRQEDMLLCSIEDNGVGRKKAQELQSANKTKHKSMGMFISRERLRIINSKNKSNLNVNVHDLEDANGKALGTRIELFVPIQ
ncbi:MAG TPA: tetratricopeptide repeat protein [Flavobacteriales bacterium]|nr:tetratricopeptide repeat protein [Flavobacteriales bacterium]